MGITFTEQFLYMQDELQNLAKKHRQKIGPVHILAAILSLPESGGYRLLDELTSMPELNLDIQCLIDQQPQSEYRTEIKAPLTRKAKDAFEAASEIVMERDSKYHTVDVVIGIIQAANSETAAIIAKHGLNFDNLDQHLKTYGPYQDV